MALAVGDRLLIRIPAAKPQTLPCTSSTRSCLQEISHPSDVQATEEVTAPLADVTVLQLSEGQQVPVQQAG
jgi:hypothetical protein